MPIHKNKERSSRVTLTVTDSFDRIISDWGVDDVVQDWFSVTEATVDADINTAVVDFAILDSTITDAVIAENGDALVLPWISQDGTDNNLIRSAAQTAQIIADWLIHFDTTRNIEVTGGTNLDVVGKYDWTVSGNIITGVQKTGTTLAEPHPDVTNITPFFLNNGRTFTSDTGGNYYSQSRNSVTLEIASTGGSTTIFNRGDIIGTGNGFVATNSLTCSIDLIVGAVMTWSSNGDSLQVTGASTDILFIDLPNDPDNVAGQVGTIVQETDYTQVVDTDRFSGTITLSSGDWEDLGFDITTEEVAGETIIVADYFFNFGDIARANESGTPDWTGRVNTLYSEGTNTLVQLTVLTGASNLAAARGTDGTLINNNILDRLFEQEYPTVRVDILDAKTSLDNGYTFFGDITNEDFYGDVVYGYDEVTQTGVEINFGSALTTTSNLSFNLDFPDNVINSLAKMGFNTSSARVAGTPTIIGPFGGRMFVQANHTQSQAGKVTDWAKALNEDSRSLIGATVSGTHQLRLFYKDGTTNITANPTIDKNELVGSFNSTQPITTATVGTVLSFADDINRTGDSTGVKFTELTLGSDHNDWADIEFARGATVTLDRGFKLNIGQGYDFTGDAKDGVLSVIENSQFLLSYDNRDDLWGGKAPDTIHRTVAHPFTVNKETGGQILISNIERVRTGTGGSNRTFMNGEFTAVIASNLGSLVFNTDNSGTGFYSTAQSFYYPMPGNNINNQIVINCPPNSAQVFYEVSSNVKQFDGDKIVFHAGNLLFNGSPNSGGTAANWDYASQWICGDMDFSGDIIDTNITSGVPIIGLGPRNNNFYFFDLTRDNTPYVDNWQWNGTAGSGRVKLTRRWNPAWNYFGDTVTNIQESYYYQDRSESTLVTVKEGGESDVIGTVGTQTHPFETGVTISSTVGLANINIGSDLSAYTPDGTTWPTNKPGLCLTYLDGTDPTTAPHIDTLDEDNTTAFSYTRRDGFRPYFTSIDMRGEKSGFNPITDLNPLLDPHWQANTISAIDTYTAEAVAAGPGTTVVRTVDTNASLATSFITRGDWNDNYRFIEHHENYDNIHFGSTSDNTRANSSELNGLFRRLIDIDTPVNSKGLMNINQGRVSLFVNVDQTISTEANAIRGVDAGSQDIVVAHNVGNATLSFTGDLDTTGGLIVESHTLNGVMTLSNSVFNIGGTMQVTVIVDGTSGDTISLDDCIVTAGTFTFGGSYRTFSEATDPTYTANRTTFNVTNDITFIDQLDTVNVNTTADITINGLADDCRFGSDTQSAGDVDYGTTATAARNLVYATTITLPATVTGGTFVATGAIDTDSLVNECTTATITGSGIDLGDVTTCTIDGLTADVELETVSSTTVSNAGDVDVEGLFNGSTITATGTVTSTGDVEDSSITAASFVVSTSSTSFTGTAAVANVTTSATILTLGD